MVEFLELLMPKPRRRLPVTRGECAEGARPCPHVTCRYHLRESATSKDTCILDGVQEHGLSHQAVADAMGLTKVGVIKIEARAMAKIARLTRDVFETREHPEDPYIRYTMMGADELAEVTAILRERAKQR